VAGERSHSSGACLAIVSVERFELRFHLGVTFTGVALEGGSVADGHVAARVVEDPLPSDNVRDASET